MRNYIHICMHTYIPRHVYIYTYICICIYSYAHICLYIEIPIYVHINMYMYIYICLYIYMDIDSMYIYMYSSFWSFTDTGFNYVYTVKYHYFVKKPQINENVSLCQCMVRETNRLRLRQWHRDVNVFVSYQTWSNMRGNDVGHSPIIARLQSHLPAS